VIAKNVAELLGIISAYYPHNPIPPQALREWTADLTDVVFEDALMGWRRYRSERGHPYPPTAQQIVEYAHAIRPPTDPSEDELRRRRHAYLERNGYEIPEWDR
jgi:hypothetical protein